MKYLHPSPMGSNFIFIFMEQVSKRELHSFDDYLYQGKEIMLSLHQIFDDR